MTHLQIHTTAEIADAVARVIRENGLSAQSEWLTAAQLAERLGVKRATIVQSNTLTNGEWWAKNAGEALNIG